MAVELTPITDADIGDVADFLRVYMNTPRDIWARACVPPWKVDAPNYGFMLRDGQRVVGVQLAFYSERLVAGRAERFCNLGAWIVLPEFRFHSLRLIMAVLAQDGHHFTSFSPVDRTRAILTQLKFRPFDTSAALVPNLPWPTLPGRTRISDKPDVIERTLAGAESGAVPRSRTSDGGSSPRAYSRPGLLLRHVPRGPVQGPVVRRPALCRRSRPVPAGSAPADSPSAAPSPAGGDAG